MTSQPSDYSGLTLETLRRAVAIYLEQAYEGVEPPPAVRRRLVWPDGIEPAALLGGPLFERANREAPGVVPIYALRLGNARYPHMKLQLQPWDGPVGFLLSVNTHDQALSIDPNSTDAEAFREVQGENQRIKERIEVAWEQAGLPTFLGYLRSYLAAHPGAPPPSVGA